MPANPPLIVVGHRASSKGARSTDGSINEFDYNTEVAAIIAGETGFPIMFRDDTREGYAALPGRINAARPSFVLSLHLNAFDGEASGAEALYYHSSSHGKRIAEDLATRMANLLGIKNRGGRPKHTEDRGGYLLRYTNMPCVIAEPAFVDNPRDQHVLVAKKESLARLYADVMSEAHDRITGDSTTG